MTMIAQIISSIIFTTAVILAIKYVYSVYGL